jgi:hypothetical protein
MPDIKCPSCGHEFPLEDALNDELKEAIEKEKAGACGSKWRPTKSKRKRS